MRTKAEIEEKIHRLEQIYHRIGADPAIGDQIDLLEWVLEESEAK
jgi:hypothetical protein